MPRTREMENSIASREMRALELNAEYFGVSRLQLMESAGRSVALETASRFKPNKRITLFCGLGGNGGDGFAAARHLLSRGFGDITIVLAGKAKDVSDESAKQNFAALQSLSSEVPIIEAYDSTLIPETEADVVVDALLGTGTKGRLKPPVLQLVRKINSMKAFKIAVDVPTGVDADTGVVLGEAVRAHLTVTFHRTKPGLKKAKKHVGELLVCDIGIPKRFEDFAGPGDVLLVTLNRPAESHKGDFGRLLVIGGSETYSGAPALVASAAYRTGVDLAYIAAPEMTASTISSMSPDLITIKLGGRNLNPKNVDVLRDFIQKVDAVAMGPGLGMRHETGEVVKEIISEIETAQKPLLLDADGLKAFAEFKRKLKIPSVFTPHAGEYAILAGHRLPDSLHARIEDVRKEAEKLDAVILLKGAVDIISDGKRVKLNFTGNPGMTVGGTGDVLSGVVGALLAQKVDVFEAAVAGAFVNGAAGDLVAEEKGYHMVASDLFDWIPMVLNDPMIHAEMRNKHVGTGKD